jgi:MGT family glycosyltransferase
MNAPKRFLFAITDAGGSVPPDTSVIRALVERGHDVRVLADRVLAPDIEPTGAAHVPWTTAPQRPDLQPTSMLIQDWDARTPQQAFLRALEGVMTGPAARFADDVRAELQRQPADVVVANMFLLGAQLGAQAEGVRVAVLIPNLFALPGWGIPPIGPGLSPMRGPLGRLRDAAIGRVTVRLFDRGLDDLNATRRANGLPPLDHTLDQFTEADRILILTSRAFEFEQYSPADQVRFCGPRLDDPAWAGDWTPPPGDEPLVLVGLSSTFMDHSDLLRRVAAALGELPVRGVLTTGPAIDPESIDAPANVQVVRSAPHNQVLPHAAAVVTHAGHGTVIKALAAGVPQVCLPLGRDQLDNAARVAWHGAGLRLKPKAKPTAIAAAVRRVIDEPSFAQGARRMAAAIAQDVREDRAVAELEELAGEAGQRPAATRDAAYSATTPANAPNSRSAVPAWPGR